MSPCDAAAASRAASLVAAGPNAPLFIVLNCVAGSRDPASEREKIGEILDAAGREYEIHTVADVRELPALARRVTALALARRGVLVAAGGDGTINALVQAVLGKPCALGVLPQGTFNYFARNWGIPEDTAEATRLLLRARPRPVQIGLVNERVFVVNASLGLYPSVLQDREWFKRQFGRSRLVALWAGIATILGEHRPIRLSIEHRGELRTVRTPTLFIGNNRLQLEQVGIPEAVDVEQGKLVAIMPRPVGTLTLMWLTLRGLFGRLGDASDVTSFGFERIAVKRMGRWRRRRVRVAADGELAWLETPLEFRVAPHPLYLLAPEENPGTEGLA